MNKKKSSKVFSVVAISSSVGERDSVSFEDENNSLDSTKSVKAHLKKHALAAKGSHSWNTYDYKDVSISSVEEVILEESKDITLTSSNINPHHRIPIYRDN